VSGSDELAIKETVLDYFEGWFDGDRVRMERALHPQLAKRSPTEAGVDLDNDTAREMIEATAAGRGKRSDPSERRVDVRIVEIHRKIATVVVHSAVYREYLHLARFRDGWKIVNALWDRP
jgi:hypothetical protein